MQTSEAKSLELFATDQLVIRHKGIDFRGNLNSGRGAILTDDLPRAMSILARAGSFVGDVEYLGPATVSGDDMAIVEKGGKVYRCGGSSFEGSRPPFKRVFDTEMVIAKDGTGAILGFAASLGASARGISCTSLLDIKRIVDLRIEQLLITYPEPAEVGAKK